MFARSLRSQNVRREFAFQMELGKEELAAVVPNIGEHQITVQGIADMVFEEDGGWVLVDFKTDRASQQTLYERYQRQLSLYARMIAGSTGMPVKQKILYSFYLGREIFIQ